MQETQEHSKELSGIELSGVSFGYQPGSPPVISGVDLVIPAGEFFVLLGPSGCGKTTVLDLIAGFIRPLAGTLLVAGRPVTRPGIDRVVVFQGDDSLLGWKTALENVEFGLYLAGASKNVRRQRASEAVETVGLSGHENKYPRELSGGMKQRVQIARALVSQSPVMLMDEPFGALDAMTRTNLQDEVSRLWEQYKRTVVFITHDIAEAVTLGDRVGIMGGSPAGLVSVVPNELPRPRSRRSNGFGTMYGEIEAALTSGTTASVDNQGNDPHPPVSLHGSIEGSAR